MLPLLILGGGVDENGYLRVFAMQGVIVNQDGVVKSVNFPQSVAVRDLNGDGLPDLIVADTRGYFWYFENHGEVGQPKFNRGEIIPIWFQGFKDLDSFSHRRGQPACNKIALADLTGDGKLGLIIGNFEGKLFFLPNSGGKNNPAFTQPVDISKVVLSTDSKGNLWGNYFSPCYYDWFGTGNKALIIGEGSYSANNIYIFQNQLSTQTPHFNEETRQILIRGMGKEHLTPQVIDWNGDGKPDIVTGEREGYVSVYLNNAEDKKTISFQPSQIIKFADSDHPVHELSSPTIADLNDDKLPDFVFGQASGRIGISLNKGTAQDFRFGPVADLKGEEPFPRFAASNSWGLDAPACSTYDIFKVVSSDPKDTVAYESKFSPPPNSEGKRSLKLEFTESGNKIFKNLLPLLPKDSSYRIFYKTRVALKPKVKYQLSFSQMGSGFDRAYCQFFCMEDFGDEGWHDYVLLGPVEGGFSPAGNWSRVSKSFSYKKVERKNEDLNSPLDFELSIVLDQGCGFFYLDDVVLNEEKNNIL